MAESLCPDVTRPPHHEVDVQQAMSLIASLRSIYLQRVYRQTVRLSSLESMIDRVLCRSSLVKILKSFEELKR
jgi:hypothetical protein